MSSNYMHHIDIDFPHDGPLRESTEIALQRMKLCELDIQKEAWNRHKPLLSEALTMALLNLHEGSVIDTKWLTNMIIDYCHPSFNMCAIPVLKPYRTDSPKDFYCPNIVDVDQPTHIISIRNRGGLSSSYLRTSLQSSNSSISWYSSLSCSLSHFGGLPYLRPGEVFPTCRYCTAPLRLLFQILECDIPVEIRDAYVPELVLADMQRQKTNAASSSSSTDEPFDDSLLQAFCCSSQCCWDRSTDGDSLKCYDTCFTSDTSTQWVNPTDRIRWIKAPRSAATPSKSVLVDPHVAEKGDQCQILAGWQLRTDLVGVDEAIEEYKINMYSDDQDLLEDAFLEDETRSLRIPDKFGGFPVSGYHTGYDKCSECGENMQVLFCLQDLCSYMMKKSYCYHVCVCPVHKGLFLATLR